jgi:hypothetical protein
MRSETTRATMSVMPPAANGTITVMGLFGKPCARAFTVPPSATAYAIRASTHFHFIDFLPFYLRKHGMRTGGVKGAGRMADGRK